MIGPGNVQYTYAQLEGIWNQAGGNPQNAPMAAAISMAESGGNSAAYGDNTNGSQDRGLWQINSIHGAQSTFDVMGNARAAVAISNNGANWRPWCTAYSDAACGTKGGTYLGSGAPFYRYLQGNIPPDLNAPINATNAAANQPSGGTTAQQAQLTGCNWWESVAFAPECAAAGLLPGSTEDIVGKAIEGIIKGILNPFISIIAGILGITGGGIIMIAGGVALVQQSKTVQGVEKGAAGIALMAVAPEAAPEVAGAAVASRTTASRNVGGTRVTRTTSRQAAPQSSPSDIIRAEAYRYNSYANYMKEQRLANAQQGG